MSSEDFKSFIVTNPDLVDEGIDVSGLRTTTDASILGNIPDYGGIQYEAYNPNRLSDLMRLYSGGFPMLDTPQAAQDFTGGEMIDTGGGGGMDQATGGLDLGDTTITGGTNLNDYESIGDTTMPSNLTSNMVGNIDPTPVDTYTSPTANVAPDGTSLGNTNTGLEDYLDIDYTTPVVLGSGNNALGLQDPQSLAIGPSGAVNLQTGPGIDDLLDDAILTSAQAPVEQASPGIMNPYDPSQNTVLGQDGIDRFDEGEAGIDLDPSAGIEDIPVELPATNIETEFEPQAVNTILGPDGITYDAVTGNPIYEDLDAQAAATTLELNQIQDESLKGQLSEIFTSAKDLGLSAIETAQKLVDKGIGTYNDLNQTVTVPGLGEIDVGKTLGGLALNTIVGAPISLVIYALDALGIEGGRGAVSDALGEKYGMDDIGRLTGGPMEGYSVGPDHAQTVQKRIDNIKNRTAPQTDASKQKIAELEAYKSEVIATGSSGVITEPGTVVGPGELGTQEIFDEFNQTPTEKADKEAGVDTGDASVAEDIAAADRADTAPPSDPYSGGEGGVQSGMNTPSATADDYDFSDFDEGDDSRADPTGTGNFSDTVTGNDTSPGATGGEGGAGTGGSPKIVCTMMNESYGFGSFRNKIWMKFHKDLSPEYQKGYHKLFLPLVKLSKTNKVVKKVLEHIAVHSTIDMRQATRGKTHLLGRVYRKIILPLCYWAGKND